MAEFTEIAKIRAEVISEISREMRLLYGNEYEKQIRAEAIEECKEKVREHWINGTVAHRIAEEIYASLDQLKEKQNK